MEKWTPGKSVGDEIAIDEGGWTYRWVIHRIEKETETTFRAGSYVIRKRDGLMVGAARSIKRYASDVTDEIRQNITRQKVRATMDHRYRKIKMWVDAQRDDESRDDLVQLLWPVLGPVINKAGGE